MNTTFLRTAAHSGLLAGSINRYIFISTLSVYADVSRPGTSEEDPASNRQATVALQPGEKKSAFLFELFQRFFGRLLPDVGAPPALSGDQTGLIQHAIGPAHGVEVDAQLGGQFTHGWKLVAQLQLAIGHQLFHLAGDLEVDRLVGAKVKLNLPGEWIHVICFLCIKDRLYLCIIVTIVSL